MASRFLGGRLFVGGVVTSTPTKILSAPGDSLYPAVIPREIPPIAVGAGSVTITASYEPGLVAPIDVGTGVVSVGTAAPVVDVSYVLSPGSYGVSVTGQAPSKKGIVFIPGWNDPYYDYVVSLLRFDEDPVVDEVDHTWDWYNGGTTPSTSEYISGVASRRFTSSGNDSGNDYLTTYAAGIGNSDGFPVGANDFCIELKVYPLSSGTIRGLVAQSPYINTWISYRLSIAADNTLKFEVGTASLNGDPPLVTTSSVLTIPTNEWTHVAAERYNGYLYVYINGEQTGTPAYIGTEAAYEINVPFYLGRLSGYNVSNSFNGYMDEFRLTIGAARYRGAAYVEPENNNRYMLPYSPESGRDVAEITGYAPLLGAPVPVDVNPGAGSLVVGGLAPSVGAGSEHYPGSAQISLSPSAPVLEYTQNHYPSPQPDSVIMSGAAPQLFEEMVRAPGAGSASITTQSPNAVQNELTAPPSAAVLFARYDVALQRLFASAPGEDSLSVTSIPPAVVVETVSSRQPAAYSMQVSLTAPSLFVAVEPRPGSVVAAVSGLQPTASVNGVELIGHGALSILGNVTGLSIGTVASPGGAALSVGGVDPTPVPGVVALVGVAVVEVLPSAASALEFKVASAGAEGVIVVGYAPNVASTSPMVGVDAGSLVVAGSEPSAMIGLGLVLNGNQPSIGIGVPYSLSATVNVGPVMGVKPQMSAAVSCAEILFERGWD